MSKEDTEIKLAELSDYYPNAAVETLLDLLISCDGNISLTKELLGTPPPIAKKERAQTRQITLKRFADSGAESQFEVKKQRLNIKGKPIHVYDPENVAQVLPCTMHLNVLPQELANRLLTTMMKESNSWKLNKFNMNDRDSYSPHLTGVYATKFEMNKVSYNGIEQTPFIFNDDMIEAKAVVEKAVNEEIKKRGLLPYQYSKPWSSDFAVCNRYDGAKSSVGPHSDQLTHIGPHAVIACISLGVTREFRLKSKDKGKSPISVHLIHNSLIIMHAGCQEEYKHSIHPCVKLTDTHQISGPVRISLTYRMYLKDFEVDKLPKCDCQRSMILKSCAGKDSKGCHRYIWICGSTYIKGGKCSKVIFPKFSFNTDAKINTGGISGSQG